MRILILGAASSIHVVRWANAFSDRGHQVHLATIHPPDPAIQPKVVIHRFPHVYGLGYFLGYFGIGSLEKSIQPDVVNVHYASGYGTLSRGISMTPIVMNIWGSDIFDFPGKSPLHHWHLLKNLINADRIVSTSEVMAEKARELKSDLRSSVIPFGVDTHVFKPDNERSKNEPKVIGTVKALAHVYGIDTLLKAFALVVNRSVEPVRLKILGEGPQRNELLRLANVLGIASMVDFSGKVPHSKVPAVLNGFDIYCALSRSESFGVAVVEASACALPVVVSDVGGLPEVVKDGVTGTIVPPDDPEAAAGAILDLLTSSETAWSFGDAGRKFVQQRFDWNNSVTRMLDVFGEVIEERKP